MSSRAVAALRIQPAGDGRTLRLSLLADGAPERSAETAFAPPVQPADAGDARWLLEDYPRLRGASADPIARRIEARLEELAAGLRQAVFGAEPVRPIAERIADPALAARLRVSVEESPGGPWIPWELMLAPGSSAPLSVTAESFTRAPSQSPAEPRVGGDVPPRVLLVTCRPGNEDDVPFRSVASRIVQAVSAANRQDLAIDVVRPPTYAALRDRLASARRAGTPYGVVHFDGHGVYRPDALNPDRMRGYLAFEAPDGGVEEVTGSVLGKDLAEAGVRWLLLNACRSAYVEPAPAMDAEPEERAFGSLAGEVRASGVEGVLAVGYNIYVVTAAALVADCYAALAAGRDLSRAVTHARRRLHDRGQTAAAGKYDWLVPVAFGAAASAGSPGDAGNREIRSLEVLVSSTTPTSPAVVDDGAADGPRSDRRPFFGFDAELLRLDRECTAGRVVEVVGLAGSGKSAVVGELARWWAATSADAAVVLDTAAFDSYSALNAELSARMAVAVERSGRARCMVVLEGASDALHERPDGWSAGDRESFARWVGDHAPHASPVVLTGRAPSGLAGVSRVTLIGLDRESRDELAAHAGLSAGDIRSAAGLLDWTQGVPAVVLGLPRILAGITLSERGSVRKLLWSLRSGKLEPPQLGLALMQQLGIEFVDPSRLRRTVLPFALALFQGHLADHGWHFFTEIAAAKGLRMALEGEPVALLREELKPAVRGGLACRVDGGYALHPLATIAIEPAFAGTMQALTRGDPDRTRRVMGIAWVSYIQSVSVTRAMAGRLRADVAGTVGQQRENLRSALEIALLGNWWGLALPLLHRVRDVLLADAREEEWTDLLGESMTRLEEFPPDPNEMGPESADLHVVRLLAGEAERRGDADEVQRLRALQLALARSEDITVERIPPIAE